MKLLLGFSGRIGRSQWWLAQFVNIVLLISAVGAVIAICGPDLEAIPPSQYGPALTLLVGTTLLCAWINIATTAKRYRDRNKSALWVGIVMVPYVGVFWQLIECGCLPGVSYNNAHGPSTGGDGRRVAALEAELASLQEQHGYTHQPVAAQTARYASDLRHNTVDAKPRGGFGWRSA